MSHMIVEVNGTVTQMSGRTFRTEQDVLKWADDFYTSRMRLVPVGVRFVDSGVLILCSLIWSAKPVPDSIGLGDLHFKLVVDREDAVVILNGLYRADGGGGRLELL